MQIEIRKGSSATWEMFSKISPILGLVFYDFVGFLQKHGVDSVTITSIIRPKTNDSGVHSLGRGMDIANTFPFAIGEAAMEYINMTYPYGKGLDTIMFHETNNAGDNGKHYHIQVPY